MHVSAYHLIDKHVRKTRQHNMPKLIEQRCPSVGEARYVVQCGVRLAKQANGEVGVNVRVAVVSRIKLLFCFRVEDDQVLH